jgi:3-oxoacyl-[acyl-carrier protein] reductase
MSYEIDLADHRALVTGAGQGVGEEIARTLAQAGAEVLVNDLVLERAQRVVDAIVDTGGQARPAVFDVTDYPAVLDAIAS